MNYLYVMETLFGALEAPMPGVKIGTTSNPPWQRLRAYHQSGLRFKFKYVFTGQANDIDLLNAAFHEQMEATNIKNIVPGTTCKDVYFITENEAQDTLEKLTTAHKLGVGLLYKDYTSCNKANHELKYSEDRGVIPATLVTELFNFPDNK